MTGRFLYTNPEGHVTACSEETGRRERRRLWSVCCGHNNKSSSGAGNCDILAEKEAEKPIMLISMVENVKDLGGSGYVVGKDKAVLEQYFEREE